MKSVIAQYYPGESAVHRLDPRVKVVVVTAFGLALFARDSFAALAVFGVVALIAIGVSRVPPGWFWRGLTPVFWLLGITFVAQALVARGQAFFSFGPIHLSREGLVLSVFLSLRLIVLVLIGSLLTLTTSPIALTDAIAWLGRPLRRLRVPIDELALMVTIALRFIPTLMAELENIMRAQRARGAEFSRGGLVRRARALIPVLVPLFVVSFKRADELALAMDARCYEPGQVRTRMYPLHSRPSDFVVLCGSVAVIATAAVL